MLLLFLLLAGLTAYAQPSISSFSPASGGLGATVTISGSGFTGATSVRFGELSAKFTVVSASQLTAVVPRAASTQPINVTTGAGFVLSASDFTVTRGSSVTYALVASNFAGVSGGANAAPAVADLNGNGRLDLLVGLADGTIARYEQTTVNGTAFSNLGLLSTGSANIDMGTQATVAIVDLEGNGRFNLVLGRGDGTVSEYEQTAAGAATFALVTDNLSAISTPSNTATSMTDLDGDGYLELLVGKGDGISSHSEQNTFNTDSFYRIDTNFNGLQLSGNAAPFCVDLDGNGRIDILMGTNTGAIYRYEQASAGSFTVSLVSSNFNGISAGSNAKPCVTDIDGDGLLDLLVGRGDGTISRYEQSGTVPAPSISSFTPASGPVGTSVTVTGSNLGGVSGVTVNGTAGTITGAPTATSFTFTVGAGSSTGLIGVTTAGGTASSSGNFTVGAANTAPTDITLSPSSVAENQPAGTTVGTLSSTDAQGGTFTYVFVAGGTDNGSFNIQGGNTLTTNGVFDYETKSSYTVRIRSTDSGGLSFTKDLTITVTDVAEVPTVTSFTPTSGPVGTSVTLNGTHFNDAGAVTVYFNGTAATTVTVNSNTQLTATVPTGATTGTISVQNADGTGSSSTNFTVTTLATVTTAAPGTVTSSSAVLGGSVTSATALTERGVVYVVGSGTPTTSNTKALTGTSTGSFSGAVSGLAGNTLYTVRAYAINGAGTAYGNNQTFTTGNNPPVAVDDAYTVAEDSGASTFSVLGNDTDPDAGTTLRITAVTQPANGSVTFTGTGVSFTPTSNFNGTITFTYNIADGNGGTDTGTVTVTVTAVNDAPVVTVPATQSTPQNTALVFSSASSNALFVSDVDAGSGQLEIYLGAANGAITLSTTSGITFNSGSSNGSGSMTFRGTMTAINAALNGLRFTPNNGFFGSGSLQVQASDLGNTGSGGAKSDSKTVTINVVQPANQAPVVTVPATQSTKQNTALTFSTANGNALSVADADAGSGQLSIYIQATQGAVTLSTTAGLTITAGSNGAGAIGFTGTLSAINAALNGMSFTPNNGFTGAGALQVQANDQGNTGSGGAKSDSKTVTINVVANQAPVLTASSGSTGFTAGGAAVAVDGGLTASDSDNTTLASGTVSITTGLQTAQDRLAFSNTSSATFGNIAAAYTTGTGVLTLTSSGATATVAQWQAALRAVTYNNLVAMPTGTSRIVSFRVNDGNVNSNTATKTIAITTPTPVVSSLTPNSGPVGTSVTIAGSNFTGATAVTFNGTAASSFVVNSSTQITAVVAAGTATGPLTVTTPYGTSNTVTFTVTAATTSTSVTSSANPSVFGQNVTFTAMVTNTSGSATPTGTVTFRDGATTLGTGTLNASGVATLSTSTLTVGSHSITAALTGGASFNASTSSALTQTVNAAATTTTLTSSNNPSVFGQGIYLNASVSTVAPGSGIATGTVTFKEGTTTLGTATLAASGNASLLISTLSVGSHPIVATYAATTNYGASTSNTLTQVVNNAATTTTLTSSLNPSTFGQSVTFTATVAVTSPGTGTPSGTVTFRDGSTTIGTGTISGGVATFSTSALAQGSHSITAVYGGATNIAGSTSAILTQVVNAPPTPAITTLTPNSGPVGTSVTIAGSNLSGATSVSFDGVPQSAITGNTAASLTVAVPAGVALGATDVVVTTPSGTSNILTFNVTPPAPVVTSVAASANGTYRIGQNLSFAVNFDQTVTVTGTPTLALTVGSTARTASYLNGTGTSTLFFRYTVVAGDLDTDGVTLGSSITLNGGTIKNATNTNAALTLNNVAALTGVRVDGVAPTATVATTGPNPTTSSVIPITITFSEAVTGLTAANILVTNGTKGTLTGSGTTYTLNVTASASGAVTIKVNASAAQDAAGNPNVVSNTLTVNYTPPPVSITSFTPTNGTVGTVVVITGSGFTGATGVTINNVAVASYVVDSNTQITATVDAANTSGLIRVTTPLGTGTSGTNFVVGPAVTGVTATANGLYHAGQTLTFFVAFSQAVVVNTTGGTPTVALTVGGTVRNVPYLTGSGSATLQFRYTIVANDLDTDGVALSGTGIDLNGGTIRNGSAINADLDFDNVSDTSGLLVDAVAPTVAITSSAGSSTAASPIPVTITFSEPVTGFSATSITVTNGSASGLSGSGNTFTIDITPTTAGAVTVNVAANAAQDAATNGNVAAPQFSINYTPAPTITSFTPLSGTVGTSITITGNFFIGTTAVAFNGVSATSFTVNSATSITAVVPVGVTTGRITVTTPAGTATSNSSFNFTPSTPNVLSVAVPANDTYGAGQSLDFSVVYDQAVTVTGTPTIALTVGSTARTVAYVTGSGSRTLVFRYVVAAGETDADGVALGGSIALNGGTIRNAGNVAASLTLTNVAPATGVLVDGIAPTVTLTSTATSPTSTSPIPVTITFSEPVTGLTLAGLTVTNGTASNLSGSGNTYTVSIMPAADGLVTINLAAASAQDVAGNDNAAAPQFSINYVAPTVVISSLTPDSGPVGTNVIIIGNNFTGATAVAFNGTAAGSFVVNSATSITAVVPAGAGTGPVTVTAPIGTSNGVTFTVTLPGTSTALSSSANPAALGQTVTFTATVTAATGTPTGSVTFSDGATALGTGTLNASGVATFSTGSLAAGSHPITASYGGSGSYAGSSSATLTQVVNGPVVPAITSLSPTSGPVGTSVTITGTNLAGATSVSFDGGTQTTITANSATSLTVAVPASASTGSVTVTTGNGVSNALSFTVTAQLEDLLLSAGSLSPAFAPGTLNYTLTVPGTTTSTTVTPTNAQISGGDITVNGTVVPSSSTSAAIALTPGSNTITVVVNSDNTGPARTYTVTVTRTACAVTATAQNVNVQLNANGNATVTATAVNNGSSSTCGPVTLSLNQTAFTCADLGSNAVTLTVTDNFGSSATATATVTVTAAPTATLTSLSPNPAPAGTTVTATGTNLSGATALAVNGAPATITGLTATGFTFVVPAGATATGNVVLDLPCTQSLSQAFATNYPDLTISTGTLASPTLVPAGTYGTITVTGNGVAQLTGNTVVMTAMLVDGTLSTNCQPLTGTGSFTLNDGATLQICDPAGLSSTPNTGAVRTTGAQSFSAEASYLYNGLTAQVTGNALPTTVRALIIDNNDNVTLTQSLEVSQLVRLTDGNLLLNGQNLLLLSDASGTALIDNTGGTVQGSTGTMQRHIETNPASGGYRHYASPVAGETVNTLATAGYSPNFSGAAAYNSSATPGLVTPFPTVYEYNQDRIATAASNYSTFDKGWQASLSGATMSAGTAFAVQAPGAVLVDFTGTFTTGPVAQSALNRTSANDGWHLLGNPYPAALDWSTMTMGAGQSLEGMDGAVYVFQSSGPYVGQYLTYLANMPGGSSPLIPAGSGFFVRTTTPGTPGTVRFANANRVTTFGAQPAFGRSNDIRPVVTLALAAPTGRTDATTLYADALATAGIDAAYDATKLPNTSGLNLASLTATGAVLAVDGRPVLAGRIPLSVAVPATGAYTLTAALANLPATTAVQLLDVLTGQTTDLRTAPAYAFTAVATAPATGRFFLNLTPASAPLATGSAVVRPTLTLYPNPAHAAVAVAGLSAGASVEVFDALGRAVTRATADAAGTARLTLPTGLAAGVYVVRSGTQVQRLTIE